MKTSSKRYIAPDVDEIALSLSSDILSGSPQPGGNEDIGYEDWGI